LHTARIQDSRLNRCAGLSARTLHVAARLRAHPAFVAPASALYRYKSLYSVAYVYSIPRSRTGKRSIRVFSAVVPAGGLVGWTAVACLGRRHLYIHVRTDDGTDSNNLCR